MTLRNADDLVEAGLIPPGVRDAVATVERRYAVAITPAMQSLIQEPGDPIGLQFIPDHTELETASHERADPIADDALSPIKGVVHRYPDRALLKPLLICPVYCRFCFRREHVGSGGGLLTEAELEAAYDWFAARPTIREVILTGGDPFMLSPRRLASIVQALSAIPHIDILRIHTRVPVADPERVTETLADTLDTPKSMWVVLHANHAREFTPQARTAIRLIQAHGIPILGQSVLLRGVNDDAAVLEALFRAMLAARVKPYYLHQLDPAPGTSRFHVPIEEGRQLLAQLRGRVTGLAWPTYVLDIPGGHGKVPIGPLYLDRDDHVRDPSGNRHTLPGVTSQSPASSPTIGQNLPAPAAPV
ncbi:MAG TPA: lysine-2,3-aminomutase-like protein [Acetobacteraceae bacterium]|nr:lysine-2,3-aminomutase-like protein [Acetobacteraceae bacterium]